MQRHPLEMDLALYAGGDLAGWKRMRTALHVQSCEQCREAVAEFRVHQQELIDSGEQMPAGLKWDRLAAEMTANIHLGLAAGECVSTPAPAKPSFTAGWDWRPAAVVAALMLVFGLAWSLNVGGMGVGEDVSVLQRAFVRLIHGEIGVPVERGPVVEASSKGAQLRENGETLEVIMGDMKPVSSTVSFDGSASTRYFDDDTFQMTIATVYTQ